jgi:sterol desaturase/sphingolipid hydroxylase (fatty acid hydroxylase superfamily)
MTSPAQYFEPALVIFATIAFALNAARYVLLAGAGFALVQVWRPAWVAKRVIAKETATRAQARREVALSFASMVVFALVAMGVALLSREGAIHLCPSLSCHGVWWSVMAIPLMLVVHDTWFYWTHRLLHTRPLFGVFHKAHHLSRDPTPLSSFSFHPLEALVEAAFVPLMLLALPIPRASLFAFQTIAFLMNVNGHLGVELLPARFAKTVFFRFFNTTTHHHQHHRVFTANYGLYFNWWDRLCGTNHAEYETTFVANASRAQCTEEFPAPSLAKELPQIQS